MSVLDFLPICNLDNQIKNSPKRQSTNEGQRNGTTKFYYGDGKTQSPKRVEIAKKSLLLNHFIAFVSTI